MAGPRPDTWMPFYIGDYLADTMHLGRDQHGAYFLLILAYWRAGGPLPDDDARLAAITKSTASEWRKLRPVMVAFFRQVNGKWHHKRIDAELATAAKNTNARSEAGAEGARRRWQRDGKAIANASQSDGEAMTNASQNDAPSPSPTSSLRSEANDAGASLEGAPAPATPRSAANGRSNRKTRIADDWWPDPEDRQYAVDRGWDGQRIDEQAEGFRDHHTAKDSIFADWRAAWRTWVRNADEFAARNGHRFGGAAQHTATRSGSFAAAAHRVAARYDMGNE